MVRKIPTLAEIRRAGMEALFERLGPVGTVRFLKQYDLGQGDYTQERHAWLDSLTLDDIIKDIEERRAKGSGADDMEAQD